MKNVFLKVMLLISFFSVGGAFGATLDTSKSVIKWTGTKVTGKHWGKIGIKSSKVELADGMLKNATIVMDMNKVTVDDLSGKSAKKFVEHMLSKDFFNVEKAQNKTAKLVISKADDKKMYGTLTIMGKSNPIEFEYLNIDGMFAGTMKFDRTKYGMKYGSGSFFKSLGDKAIDNEVVLDFIVAVK